MRRSSGIRRKDLTGKVFGYLTIKSFNGIIDAQATWLCVCKCGETRINRTANLTSGRTKSCGCLTIKEKTKHGLWNKPEYAAWLNMWKRTTNKKSKDYKYYGARGIKVCEEWKDVKTFVKDMGPRPKAYSIERINNNGNYEPSNCKWIPKNEQSKNRRNSKAKVEVDTFKEVRE